MDKQNQNKTYLQKRNQRNHALVKDGGSSKSGEQRRVSEAMEGSTRTCFDILFYL